MYLSAAEALHRKIFDQDPLLGFVHSGFSPETKVKGTSTFPCRHSKDHVKPHILPSSNNVTDLASPV
jgi:hypothetical protein